MPGTRKRCCDALGSGLERQQAALLSFSDRAVRCPFAACWAVCACSSMCRVKSASLGVLPERKEKEKKGKVVAVRQS